MPHEHHSINESSGPTFTDASSAAPITDFCVAPGARTAYSGDSTGCIAKWNLDTGAVLASVAVAERPVLGVGADGKDLFVIVDRELLRLDLDCRLLDRRPIPCNGVLAAQISIDARLALICRRDEGIQCLSPALFDPCAANYQRPQCEDERKIWIDGDAATWLSRVPGHWSRPNIVAMASDNSCAITLSVHDPRCKLRVWSLNDGSCRELQGYDGAFAIAVHATFGFSGRYCAAANQRSIMMFDVGSGGFIDAHDSHLDGHATALAVSPDGQRLLIGYSTGGVELINVDPNRGFDYQSRQQLGRRAQAVSGVKFAGPGRVVSASGHRLRCWIIDADEDS